MKCVAVLMGTAALAPSVARAQIPLAPPPAPAATPAPAAPAGPARPAAAPAPTPPGPAPASAPDTKAPPGDEYYVEPAPPAPAPPATGPDEPPPFEPPPPGAVFIEPPPPPVVRHVAPQRSLWLGARLGWFFPFGNVWARANPVSTSGGSGYVLEGIPWRDYATSGPVLEIDAGLRLSRSYTVFGSWERTQLGAGNYDTGPDGAQRRAESDFWAIGLRASSNPDHLGLLTEVAVGYRRARTIFENDAEYQFTDAPFEARLGLGAELRLNRLSSLSSLITIGVGGFGSAERVAPNGNSVSLIRDIDEGDGHAWLTLSIGGHLDLIPSAR